MIERVLNEEALKLMQLFESLTGIIPKDCFYDDYKILFIVKKTDVDKSLKKLPVLRSVIKKKFRIINFDGNLVNFINNLLYPIKAIIDVSNKNITIFTERSLVGKVIGRERKNLNLVKTILKRFFDVNEVMVKYGEKIQRTECSESIEEKKT